MTDMAAVLDWMREEGFNPCIDGAFRSGAATVVLDDTDVVVRHVTADTARVALWDVRLSNAPLPLVLDVIERARHEDVVTVRVQTGQRVRVGDHVYTVMGTETSPWLLRRDGEAAANPGSKIADTVREFEAAADSASTAADGDSNDEEIDALSEAVGVAQDLVEDLREIGLVPPRQDRCPASPDGTHKPDSTPTADDICTYCLKALVWIGPGPYDWALA